MTVMTTLFLATQAILLAGAPIGWHAFARPGEYEVQLDDQGPREGRRSLCLRALVARPSDGFVTQIVKAERWRGKRVRLSGWVRTENAQEASLWLSNNDERWMVITADIMSNRFIRGTTPWTRYELVIDVGANAMEVRFGGKLSGGGALWMDDLRLEEVDARTPLTSGTSGYASNDAPTNLGFEQ